MFEPACAARCAQLYLVCPSLSQDEICINPVWNFEGAILSRLTLCLKQLTTHAAAPVEGVKEYTALKCIRPRLASEKGRQTYEALS